MKQHSLIRQLRNEQGLSQEDFAAKIGLTGKSSVSEIERGGACSLPVAIAIETLSAGADGVPRIDAALLNADVAAARAAIATGTGLNMLRLARVADPGNADHYRVITCITCDRRLDDIAIRGCSASDCPHNEALAA